MRARYRGPAGSGTLELGDDATVQVLFDELRSKSGIASFSVKYGPPMAMKLLNLEEDGDKPARSLGLHGETFTIVPDEARPISPLYSAPAAPAPSEKRRPPASNPEASEKPEDINVPWVEKEGTLCRFQAHQVHLGPLLEEIC
jgi:ubiquitin thioesterase OTU1